MSEDEMQPITMPRCHKCYWAKHPVLSNGGALQDVCLNPDCTEAHKPEPPPVSREEKLENIIKLLLPLAAKQSGAAIVCGHCGIIFPPHDKDCPVRLAENALYLEDDDES